MSNASWLRQRLTRIAVAVVIAGCLGFIGACFQLTNFHNDIAEMCSVGECYIPYGTPSETK